MRALVLANGEPPSPLLLERLLADTDLFVATDGAANQLVGLELPPHVVLGDFDSLSEEAREKLPTTEFVDAIDQEASDLDKALGFLAARVARRVTVTGATGRRLDHTFTNVSLILKYGAEMDVRIVEDQGELRLLQREVELEGVEGDTVSIVVFEAARGVTTEGLAWPLSDATLTPGSRGVSNRLTGPRARITLREGRAIVCHLRRELR
jgi:thiamine pyrophosphokinase